MTENDQRKYFVYPCPDCDAPVKVPADADDDEEVECGNCGAGFSAYFFRRGDY